MSAQRRRYHAGGGGHWRQVMNDTVTQWNERRSPSPTPTPTQAPVVTPRRALFPHQREGADFIRRRLTEKPPGGLLGDEMRLGKTTTILTAWYEDLVITSDLRRGRPSLVVLPPVSVAVWQGELRSHFGLDVHQGMPPPGGGTRGNITVAVLTADTVRAPVHAGDMALRCDLILTTYATLTSTHRHGLSAALTSSGLRYRFIFCDEAHRIVNDDTQAHHILCRMLADAKWFVSATPLQNSAADLSAALRFIGFDAASVQTPDQCRQALRRVHIRHTQREVAATMNVAADVPHTNNNDSYSTGICRIPFASALEARVYYRCAETIAAHIAHNNEHGQGHRSFTLPAIHRLRQICVSPYIVPWTALSAGDHLMAALPANEMVLAPLSVLEFDRVGSENIHEWTACALTLSAISNQDERVMQQYRDHLFQQAGTDEIAWQNTGRAIDQLSERMLPPISSKERWICTNLLLQRADPAGEKVVFFSNWNVSLERLQRLIQLRHRYLQLPGARDCVYIHGTVPLVDRERLLNYFRTDPSVGYLLVTLHCGSLSADFSVANHVVIIDPWYNPHTEQQAIARLFGINQRRPVHVYRLVLENTIDEAIVTLAHSKMELDANLLETTRTEHELADLLTQSVRPMRVLDMSPETNTVDTVDAMNITS